MQSPNWNAFSSLIPTVVLTPGDNDMIANFVNRFEKYLELKNEVLNSSANEVAELKHVLESDPLYSVLV